MLQLRRYQLAAVQSVCNHIRSRTDNPCVVIPTGGGKTPIMAALCRDAVAWDARVMILAHVRELLEQSAATLTRFDCPASVYSAGLNRREIGRVTVAGIQSVYKNAAAFPSPQLILIDECHLIPQSGEGMYRTFIAAHPEARVVGFTATPFRTTSGALCGPDNILNVVCHETGVRELIQQGFLSPLRGKAALDSVNTDNVATRAGEFVAEDLEAAALRNTYEACKELLTLAANRKSILVFTSGVKHAEEVAKHLNAPIITGNTDSEARRQIIEDFRQARIRILVNVNVLTTGFDAPNVDCVALLRPTKSPGLYYQMVGRGFRLAPEKKDCLVLDFGGNIERHGPVDTIRAPDPKSDKPKLPPIGICPECREVIPLGVTVCPACGHEMPRQPAKHDITASDLSPTSEPVWHTVLRTAYSVHTKRDMPEGHPRTLRVDYQITPIKWVSEWVCVEHSGFARTKAEKWWKARCNEPCPNDAQEAVDLSGILNQPDAIEVTPEGKFHRITGYDLPEDNSNASIPF